MRATRKREDSRKRETDGNDQGHSVLDRPLWSACGLPPLSSPAAVRDRVPPTAPGPRLRRHRKPAPAVAGCRLHRWSQRRRARKAAASRTHSKRTEWPSGNDRQSRLDESSCYSPISRFRESSRFRASLSERVVHRGSASRGGRVRATGGAGEGGARSRAQRPFHRRGRGGGRAFQAHQRAERTAHAARDSRLRLRYL